MNQEEQTRMRAATFFLKQCQVIAEATDNYAEAVLRGKRNPTDEAVARYSTAMFHLAKALGSLRGCEPEEAVAGIYEHEQPEER